MKKLLLFVFVCLLSIISAQNIMISDAHYPNEPAIIINPNNTLEQVAASNINNLYYSHDGGLTWEYNNMQSSYGVWGDPVLDVDNNGNFYYFHLSNPPSGNWIDRIVSQKSVDGGSTWTDGTYMGLNGTKAQDKQWSVVDRKNNNIYITWTQFDSYGSSAPTCESKIMFSKSTDKGETWAEAKPINNVNGNCIDSDDTVEGAVPAVGPNGEIYVAWAGPNGLVFKKSLDEGKTWSENETAVANIPGGWDFAVAGISRANGLPITKCDLSGGENHGTIYINWSDQRNGSDNTDIFLVKSTDGGTSWTEPILVNNEHSQNHQFFTWMDIDQTNGNLYFVYYDRSAYQDRKTDAVLSYSTDGGGSFNHHTISETPFVPTSNIFFGDYTNISVHNNIVRPIWTRLHMGELSIWTDVTPLEQLNTENIIQQVDKAAIYPNPTQHFAHVSFKMHKSDKVSLDIMSASGQLLKQIINNKTYDYGKHIIELDTKQLGLTKGVYFGVLKRGDSQETIKILVE